MAADDEPFRNLGFAEDAAVFTSASQNVRVLSEGWMAMHGFCPLRRGASGRLQDQRPRGRLPLLRLRRGI